VVIADQRAQQARAGRFQERFAVGVRNGLERHLVVVFVVAAVMSYADDQSAKRHSHWSRFSTVILTALGPSVAAGRGILGN
jgi:hypothetical protein